MGSWSSGVAVLCSLSWCVLLVPSWRPRPKVRLACHNVHGRGLVPVRPGVPLRRGYAGVGARGYDSRVRWFRQVSRM